MISDRILIDSINKSYYNLRDYRVASISCVASIDTLDDVPKEELQKLVELYFLHKISIASTFRFAVTVDSDGNSDIRSLTDPETEIRRLQQAHENKADALKYILDFLFCVWHGSHFETVLSDLDDEQAVYEIVALEDGYRISYEADLNQAEITLSGDRQNMAIQVSDPKGTFEGKGHYSASDRGGLLSRWEGQATGRKDSIVVEIDYVELSGYMLPARFVSHWSSNGKENRFVFAISEHKVHCE